MIILFEYRTYDYNPSLILDFWDQTGTIDSSHLEVAPTLVIL